jgi:protein-S-isoprenylcysteine O-methyltransferase
LSAFLLNHSRAFHLALLSSLIEYFLELLLMPALKTHDTSLLIAAFSLPCLVVAQSLRSLSMYQCSTNFTHIISPYRHPQHHLITGGLYSLSRHPSYTAWYAWSVLTQLLLLNPVCTVGYAIAGWRFFASRVEYEDARLIEFFGKDYKEYQRRVWSGIPFLSMRGERVEKL